MNKPSSDSRIFVRILLWIPLSVVIMILILLASPIRKLFEHTTGVRGWGPSFFGTDFTYMCVCIAAAIVYAFVGAIVSSIYTINSRRWWITIAVLYTLYIIIMLLGLWYLSEGYFLTYGALFLDILLGPPLLLGVIEGVYTIKHQVQTVHNPS